MQHSFDRVWICWVQPRPCFYIAALLTEKVHVSKEKCFFSKKIKQRAHFHSTINQHTESVYTSKIIWTEVVANTAILNALIITKRDNLHASKIIYFDAIRVCVLFDSGIVVSQSKRQFPCIGTDVSKILNVN
jgi:hypothetical protein